MTVYSMQEARFKVNRQTYEEFKLYAAAVDIPVAELFERSFRAYQQEVSKSKRRESGWARRLLWAVGIKRLPFMKEPELHRWEELVSLNRHLAAIVVEDAVAARANSNRDKKGGRFRRPQVH